MVDVEEGQNGKAEVTHENKTVGQERWLGSCKNRTALQMSGLVPSTHAYWLTIACNCTSNGIRHVWPPWALAHSYTEIHAHAHAHDP